MTGLLLGVLVAAWAQEPDPADLSRRAEQSLLRSEGCVVVDVVVTQDLRRRGRRAHLEGRVRAELDEGTWRPSGLMIDRRQGAPMTVDFGDGLPLLLPIMGTHTRPDGSPLEHPQTQGLLALLTDEAQSEEVGRDEAGRLLLRRTFEARGGRSGPARENILLASFDEALRPRAWTVQVDLPVQGEAGRIRRMTLRLEVDEQGVPVSELLELAVGGGMRLRRHAQVRRVGTCPG